MIDVKKDGLISSRYEMFTHNGTQSTGLHPVDFAKLTEALGAGEVVVNSIDRDGVMEGYGLDLIAQERETISLPMTVMGGAGTLKEIAALIDSFGRIGAAAGSLFVFKGKYRAVLINYPNRVDKDALIAQALQSGS